MFRNQPLVDPIQNRCSWIILKIERKTSVLKSLFKKFRNIPSQMFFKIVVLKTFANFTGTICLGIFFNKVSNPQKCNFVNKWLQRRCFSVKFTKFLRIPFLQNISSGQTVSGFQSVTLLKNRLCQRWCSVNFANFLTEYLRITASCVYLWFSRSYFEKELLFDSEPLGNCLFYVPVAEFQPADTVNNYFAGAFQEFYKGTRSSLSKEFIYLNYLKIICENVNS